MEVEALLEGIRAIRPDFEDRPGQRVMATRIAHKIRSGGTLVVEAPTGIGKTLAYLAPALLSGRRVIVSTHTKNLQDQIASKDLALLERALKERMPPWAVMKGRANYLCLERLDQKHGQQTFSFFGESDVLTEIGSWAGVTESGDRAELAHLDDASPIWSDLDARSERCLGQRCPRYEDCFVVKMRRRAEASELIVVNHHLLFADLALRARARIEARPTFGEVVPLGPILIVDEAHAIEAIASDYFGGSVSSGQLERLAHDAPEWAEVDRAVKRVEELFSTIVETDGRAQLSRSHPARRMMPKAVVTLDALEARFLEQSSDPDMLALADRTRAFADRLRFVLAAEDDGYVYWLERRKKRAAIGASPVDVAGLLREHLFGAFETVVLTSATLSEGSDVSYFSRAIGAPPDAESLVLDSPFDYERQAALYLPPAAPDPSRTDAAEDVAVIGRRLIELVGGGALFLFTSRRMMQEVHRRLSDLPFPVLLQGEGPRARLLERFVSEAPAVLFATASFWEGVDVPGDALRLVLIDKLPFDAPTDPVVQARAALHADAFSRFSLPRAVLRLKQGFGRLVRHQDDRGVVCVLDRRLWTKDYGRRFLSALPPVPTHRDFDALDRWWSCKSSSHR